METESGRRTFYAGGRGTHNLVKWSTTLVMGPERGMLKPDPNDPFDTQKDLLNNLCGGILAVLLCSVAGVNSPSETESRLGPAASNPTNPK